MNLSDLKQLPVGKRNKRLEKKLNLGEYTTYWFRADYSFEEKLSEDCLDELIDTMYDIAESIGVNCWLMVTGNGTYLSLSYYNRLKLEGGVSMHNTVLTLMKSINGVLESATTDLVTE